MVGYQIEYEKRNSKSISSHALFCLFYEHTDDELCLQGTLF